MMWFTKLAFGLPRYIWLIGAVVLVAIAVIAIRSAEDADDKSNQQIGAAVQREGDLIETLERVETGNATREEITREVDRGNGDLLYAQCLRTARTRANCERFLFGGEAAER